MKRIVIISLCVFALLFNCCMCFKNRVSSLFVCLISPHVAVICKQWSCIWEPLKFEYRTSIYLVRISLPRLGVFTLDQVLYAPGLSWLQWSLRWILRPFYSHKPRQFDSFRKYLMCLLTRWRSLLVVRVIIVFAKYKCRWLQILFFFYGFFLVLPQLFLICVGAVYSEIEIVYFLALEFSHCM